jgi:2-keto-4-pentenoate hydratase/2-oxohepta-3-ene-1,7-dioic acid hydratase in catechol pathway
MKLFSHIRAGALRIGRLVGDRAEDITDACGTNELVSVIANWAQLHARLSPDCGEALEISQIQFAAPLRPSTVLCAGSNYRQHNSEKAASPTSGKEPEFFVKTVDCLVGPFDDLPCDAQLTKKLDGETELAIVIGKAGRHIPVEKALSHVFGYTVSNDVTARDRQVRSRDGFVWYELGRGKVFDGSLVLGPYVATADEIPDPQNLMLSTVVNGELRQQSSTSEMIWNCAELISNFSINLTLQPGMTILTGTPAGTAWSYDKDLGGKGHNIPGLEPALRYLLPGDVIESSISGIGATRNWVKEASPASYSPE